jgi:HD superfamily phosphodiesterase
MSLKGDKKQKFLLLLFSYPEMRHDYIDEAESKYRSLLTEECRKLFSDINLPSHDHHHHIRVWENASLLLSRLYDTGMISDPLMAEKAIIASFFHDTGLTVNRGVDHGAQSRLICSEFLKKCDISVSDQAEILDAVERHDDKEYTALSDPVSLAAIISVADDMDAFGQTGIERYTEIYSLRGISSDELPHMVTDNVISRFRHLRSTYAMFPDIIEDQQKRVNTVIEHFTKQKK